MRLSCRPPLDASVLCIHSYGILKHARSRFRQTFCLGLVVAGSTGLATANPAEARRLLDRGAYESARDLYEELADRTNSASRRASLRMGQGLAAYRAGDFRGARAGYSDALLSPDSKVRKSAHHGMGNSLFQLGWLGLADAPYPANPADTPDLDAFDRMVRERIGNMLDSPEPESGETDGFVRIRNTILNWSDAARHYQSALEIDPRDRAVLHNRRTTLVFLERLQELLEEEQNETEQSMPEPTPGEGEPQPEPQPGEGEESEEPGDTGEEGDATEEQGDESSGDPRQQGEQDGEPEEGESDGEPQDEEPDDDEPQSGDEEQESEPVDPNESPEDRARRILSENADVETGPLNPGRREFLPPAKDW